MKEKKLFCISAIISFFIFTLPVSYSAWAADQLVATVSRNLVAIRADFTGSNVILFGSSRDSGNIVITVRGPTISKTVYRKQRIAGIWLNYEGKTYSNIPSYYRVFTTHDFGDWLPEKVRERHQIGLDYLSLQEENSLLPEFAGSSSFAKAVAEIYQRAGYYAEISRGVDIIGNNLFRSNIDIPANAAPGTYLVEVLLIRDGEVTSAQVLPFFVRKTGFTVTLFNFSQKLSWLYGICSILLAIGAGFAANWAFKRYNF